MDTDPLCVTPTDPAGGNSITSIPQSSSRSPGPKCFLRAPGRALLPFKGTIPLAPDPSRELALALSEGARLKLLKLADRCITPSGAAVTRSALSVPPVDDPARARGDRGERLCIPAMGERSVGLAMGERGEHGDPDPFVLELAVRLGAETRAARARALGCPVLGRGCAGALAVSSLDPMCRSCGVVAGGRGRPAKGCVPTARTGAARGLLRGCFAPPCSSSAASAIAVASFLLREAPHMLGVAWRDISVPCPHLATWSRPPSKRSLERTPQ